MWVVENVGVGISRPNEHLVGVGISRQEGQKVKGSDHPVQSPLHRSRFTSRGCVIPQPRPLLGH